MSRALGLFRAGSVLSGLVPLRLLVKLAQSGARVLAFVRPATVESLAVNLEHVVPGRVDNTLLGDSLASYSRYWAETFRVPGLSEVQLDRGFSFVGLEQIEDARAAGVGPIIVLPHLGGWEWAAAWLGRVANRPVTAVVERLEPDDLFDWFVDHRSSYNVNVVPLGGSAMAELTRAVRERHVLCLLSDRDIAGNGIEVEFFGEPTMMPLGPALLSIRTGAPLVPTAVMFREHDRFCSLGTAIYAGTEGSLRERAGVLTQEYATKLEDLIRQAPDQWHVLAPIWPEEGR